MKYWERIKAKRSSASETVNPTQKNRKISEILQLKLTLIASRESESTSPNG